MNETLKSLTKKIAFFTVALLLFLGVETLDEALKSVTDGFDEAKQKYIATDGTITKPELKDVGDGLFDTLATGGQLINPTVENDPKRTTFEKWVGIIKGGWDAIEGGAGSLISLFEALIKGHKAKVAAEVPTMATSK